MSRMVLIDHVIESAKIGLRPRTPRICQAMRSELTRSAACISTISAREKGMTTIKVVNAGQAIAELEMATGLSLPEVA